MQDRIYFMLLSNAEIQMYSMPPFTAFQELHCPSHILKQEQQAFWGQTLFFFQVPWSWQRNNNLEVRGFLFIPCSSPYPLTESFLTLFLSGSDYPELQSTCTFLTLLSLGSA